MSKQMRLASRKTTVPAKQAAEQEANLIAARIILASRERYAGLQVEWAEMIVEKSAERLECK